MTKCQLRPSFCFTFLATSDIDTQLTITMRVVQSAEVYSDSGTKFRLLTG